MDLPASPPSRSPAERLAGGDTRDLLRNDLDLAGHPQVVLRIGAGGPVAPTPRRRVEDVVTVES